MQTVKGIAVLPERRREWSPSLVLVLTLAVYFAGRKRLDTTPTGRSQEVSEEVV